MLYIFIEIIDINWLLIKVCNYILIRKDRDARY